MTAYFGLAVEVDASPIAVSAVTTGAGKKRKLCDEAVRIEHPRGGAMQCMAKGDGDEQQVLVAHVARYASTRLKGDAIGNSNGSVSASASASASSISGGGSRGGTSGGGSRRRSVAESPVRAVLVVTSHDLYAADLAYVFGQARFTGQFSSLISVSV